MKTQPALVRAEGTVHLDAKPAIHLDLAFIVDPGNPKLNQPLWFHQTLQDLAVSVFLVTLNNRPDRFQHFGYRLKKLRFVGITFSDDFQNFRNQCHNDLLSEKNENFVEICLENQGALACSRF